MYMINKDLEKEYERLTKEYPDIEGISAPLINISDVLKAYFCLADYFSDPDSKNQEKMLVGIRSIDLLGSALGRQVVMFGGKTKYTDPIDICSTLFFGLVKDHAFADGNKRTALLVLLYQLWTYGYYPNVGIKEFEKLVVAVAANTLSSEFPFDWEKNYKDKATKEKSKDAEVKTIACIISKFVTRKNNSFHLNIKIKTFVDALGKNGVTYSLDNGKLHFERVIKHGLLRKPEIARHAIVFGGWTRIIGAGAARDVLQDLKLYDQFPTYQSFINGEEAFYSYIAHFEGPLRRLKDK